MINMDSNILICRSEDFLSSEIDGEMVMMNIETGAYIALNETGKSIWNLVIEPKKIHDIISSLMKEYDVTKEVCENDVLPFIQLLLEQKIILRN